LEVKIMAWMRWLRGSKRPLSARSTRFARPEIEALEGRIVPFVKSFDAVTGGLLVTASGAGAENITIASSKADNFIRINGQVIIDVNGQGVNKEVLVTQIKGINLQGGIGNDTLAISSDNDAFVGKILRIEGGDGNDKISVNLLDNAFYELNGGAGNDTILGGAGSDTLRGAIGTDSLFGGGGNDALEGGAENDTLQGGDGGDFVNGDLGNDSIDGGTGDDALDGGEGNDSVIGGLGHDMLQGGLGIDTLGGGDDNDTLFGGDGNDFLLGGQGDDTLDGGIDSDELRGGQGNDALEGGEGADRIIIEADWGSDTVTDAGAALPAASKGMFDGDGVIFLNMPNDLLFAISKNGFTVTEDIDGPIVINPNTVTHKGNAIEYLSGGSKNDTFEMLELPAAPIGLYGAQGVNTLDYRAFKTGVSVGLGTTVATVDKFSFYQGGGTGTRGVGAIDILYGGDGNDVLGGSNNNNTLIGGLGNDTLGGGGSNDVLEGGAGNDVVDGGLGSDQFIFKGSNLGQDTIAEMVFGIDLDTDVLDFSQFDAGDNSGIKLQLETTAAQTANKGNLILALVTPGSIEAVIGTNFADTIIGGKLAESLIGGEGNDTLTAGLGNDTVDGGNGIDLLIEAGNVNFLLTNVSLTGVGTDKLAGMEEARLTGGSGNNKLDAGLFSGPVTLTGGAGNDTLTGGEGSDLLEGNAGNDVYVFGSSAGEQLDKIHEASGGGIDRLDFTSLGAGNGLVVDLGSDAALAVHTDRIVQTAALGQAAFIEQVIGSAGDDAITGNAANNLLSGGAGHDWLLGMAGTDALLGGVGDDTYAFADITIKQTVTVTELAGQGMDRLDFSALPDTRAAKINLGSNTLATAGTLTVKTAALGQFNHWEEAMGGAGSDTLTGNSKANLLDGGLGNDSLQGLGAGDILLGGAGADTLDGSLGNDLIDGGLGIDLWKFNGTAAIDFIDADWDGLSRLVVQRRAAQPNGQPTANPVESDEGSGVEDLAISGMAGNDRIDCSALTKADALNAGLIHTLLSGGAGSDKLTGGGAIDRLVETGNVNFTLTASKLTGLGTDTLTGMDEAELTGGLSNNKLDAAAFGGNVTLRGGAGNDSLVGGTGNDLLDGALGTDTLNGGSGADVGLNGEVVSNVP
jgi:Ca2+-binding RTX toxin-like protein